MNDNNQNNKYNKKTAVKTYTDYNIFQGKIRLITDNGVKIIERDEAIAQAKSQNMNLVQISYDKTNFPHSVCKIIDYGKFLYEQNKNQKKQKKQERLNQADLKEITFSIRIDTGDKNTKINHIREFIEDGDNVRVTVKLSRREMRLVGMAKDLINEVCNTVNDIAEIDSGISVNGAFITCVLKKKKK